MEGSFWLARASDDQKESIAVTFAGKVSERWSEILYSPELRFTAPGKPGSMFGRLDAPHCYATLLRGWCVCLEGGTALNAISVRLEQRMYDFDVAHHGLNPRV